ncbi:MAG: sterol desaturase family protein, partial [Verrucomicrobiaceae bacterium]|nr:sterol desaturase family protein [Verrucomicrobiaceae bacterium]
MDLFKEKLALSIGMPVLLALIIAEVIFTHFHNIKAYSRKETLTNIYLALCNGTLDLTMRAITYAWLVFCFQFTPFHWSHGVGYWVALFLLE